MLPGHSTIQQATRLPRLITKEKSHNTLPLSLTILPDPPHLNSKSTTGCGPAQWEKKMLFPLSKSDTGLHRSLVAQGEIPAITPHHPLGKIKRNQTTAARLEALDRTQGTLA